jgi:hypothetical protein
MSCLECTKTRLTNLGIPSNRIRTHVNPLTGKTLTYVQGRPLVSIEHQTEIFNPDLFKQELTREMTSQSGVDAYCDSVTYIQGIISDTVYPSVWAAVDVTASGQLMVVGSDARLLFGWDDFVFAVVVILMTPAFWVAVALVVALAIVIVVVGYLAREPQYNFTDPSGNRTSGSWTQYISNQNTKYWYVCSKDGYGVGERSIYAKPADVPADQIALFNDHCNNAPDLKPPDWTTGLLMQIVYASLAIGGIYIAIKLIPPLFAKK